MMKSKMSLSSTYQIVIFPGSFNYLVTLHSVIQTYIECNLDVNSEIPIKLDLLWVMTMKLLKLYIFCHSAVFSGDVAVSCRIR